MKCNGKCQMAKKILAEQEKEEKVPESKGENKYQVIWSNSLFASLDNSSPFLTTGQNLPRTQHKPSGYIQSIFRPPCLA